MYLLLADDNPVTLQFLAEAVRQLGHRSAVASDGTAALALARREHFDLLLLDLQMPGLDGKAVLRQLRGDSQARCQHSPALATTAETGPALARQLIADGFAAVLAKPLDLATLERALQGWHSFHGMLAEDLEEYAALPLLDDDAAIARLGTRETVQALRRLFALELLALPAELDDGLAAANRAGQLRERLHRLLASAGFCGAARLERAIRDLRKQIERDAALTAEHLRELREVTAATLGVLEDGPAA